jgi:hypothetical protein
MALRPYALKQAAKYFTLYFIPLFQTSTLGEFVECQVCFTPFTKEVLTFRSEHERDLQAQKDYLRGIKAISDQMDAGIPIQVLASSLVRSGLTERTAAIALYAATKGEIRRCPKCSSVFKATVGFCSTCGTELLAKTSL